MRVSNVDYHEFFELAFAKIVYGVQKYLCNRFRDLKAVLTLQIFLTIHNGLPSLADKT